MNSNVNTRPLNVQEAADALVEAHREYHAAREKETAISREATQATNELNVAIKALQQAHADLTDAVTRGVTRGDVGQPFRDAGTLGPCPTQSNVESDPRPGHPRL